MTPRNPGGRERTHPGISRWWVALPCESIRMAGSSKLAALSGERIKEEIPGTTPLRHRVVTVLGYRPVRSTGDRLIAGVAGGLAKQLGVDAILVRLAFVVLSFVGGLGVAAYVFCWARGKEAVDSSSVRGSPRQLVAQAMIFAGLLLLLRAAGLWFGDALVLSVTLAAAGSAIIWTRNAEVSIAGRGRSDRIARHASRASRHVPALTVMAGLPLIVAGMALFLQANRALTAARNLAFAVAVTMIGLALVLGPWIWRLGRQLADERGERIRSEERADMAAHLHDSVLQTLALIQRHRDPEQMASSPADKNANCALGSMASPERSMTAGLASVRLWMRRPDGSNACIAFRWRWWS